jgi:hypothetical protein
MYTYIVDQSYCVQEELGTLEIRPVSVRAIKTCAAEFQSAGGVPAPVPAKSLSKNPTEQTSSSPPTKTPLHNTVNTAPKKKESPSIVIPSNGTKGGGVSTGDSTMSNSSWTPPKNSTPPSSARSKTSTVSLHREISSNSAGTQGTHGSNASGDSNAGKFDPSWYMGLIGEGTAAIAAYCQNDRELQKQLSDIRTMLQNKEDWELRFTGLGRLQGLVSDLSWSGLAPDSIVSSMRSMLTEAVCAITFIQYRWLDISCNMLCRYRARSLT